MKLRWLMTISLLSGAHRKHRASADPARRRVRAGVTPARAERGRHAVALPPLKA